MENLKRDKAPEDIRQQIYLREVLACAYELQEKDTEAEEQYKEAISLSEGRSDCLTVRAVAMERLGSLYMKNGRDKDAHDAFLASLDILEGCTGSLALEHTAVVCGFMGELHEEAGEAHEAEMFYRNAADTYEQLACSDPEKYLEDAMFAYHDLAEYLYSSERYEEAASGFRSALEQYDKMSGEKRALNSDAAEELMEAAEALENM